MPGQAPDAKEASTLTASEYGLILISVYLRKSASNSDCAYHPLRFFYYIPEMREDMVLCFQYIFKKGGRQAGRQFVFVEHADRSVVGHEDRSRQTNSSCARATESATLK